MIKYHDNQNYPNMKKNLVKELRLKKNLSQVELSKELGISQSLLSKWESTEDLKVIISESDWTKVSSFFGITNTSMLFFGDNQLLIERLINFYITFKGVEVNPKYAEDFVNIYGIEYIFGPLIKAGLDLVQNPPPEYSMGCLINKAKGKEKEYKKIEVNFLKKYGGLYSETFEEFIIWQESFYEVLTNLQHRNEIGKTKCDELLEGLSEYIWSKIFVNFKKLSDVEENNDYWKKIFPKLNRNYFPKIIVEYEEIICRAYEESYNQRSEDGSFLKKPTWTVGDIINQAGFDTPLSVLMDRKYNLINGNSLDPFMNKILRNLDELHHKVDHLTNKINKLEKEKNE